MRVVPILAKFSIDCRNVGLGLGIQLNKTANNRG
jgi:hypothetical protein